MLFLHAVPMPTETLVKIIDKGSDVEWAGALLHPVICVVKYCLTTQCCLFKLATPARMDLRLVCLVVCLVVERQIGALLRSLAEIVLGWHGIA